MTLPFSASHLVLFSPYIFPPPPNMPHRTTNVLLIISNLVTISPLLFLIHPTLISGTTTFTISNNCPFTIWPGTLAGSGTPPLSSTGFQLDPGKSVKLIPSTPGWSGRIWARTGCRFDKSGTGTCDTGDCGGKMECGGSGANPPASLFEITLGKGMNTEDKDFYDVSLVDGYNLPILAWPVTGSSSSSCNATGCAYDLNTGCPKELQVVGGTNRNGLQLGSSGGDQARSGGGVIACKSACEAFGQDQYCCSGEYGNPTTCKPSVYSTIFKKACPRAYSYAYDDKTSTFTCTQADNYVILFCPTPTRGAQSDGGTFATPPPIPSSPPPQALQPQPPPQAPPPPLLQPPMLHPPPQASALQPPPEAVLHLPPPQAPSPPLPESPSSKGDNMGVDTSSSPIILQPIIYVPILLLRVLSLILF